MITLEDRLLEGKVGLPAAVGDNSLGLNERPFPYERTVKRASRFTLTVEEMFNCLVRLSFGS